MNIASLKASESVEDLVKRVYAFKGTPTTAQIKAASATLSAANPVLRRLSDLRPGTRLVVPTIDGAEPTPDTQSFDAASVDSMLVGIRFLIDQATTALEDSIAQDVTETNASAALLRQRPAKAAMAAGNSAGLRKSVDDAAKQRLEAARALRVFHERVLVRIEDDLNEIQALLGG